MFSKESIFGLKNENSKDIRDIIFFFLKCDFKIFLNLKVVDGFYFWKRKSINKKSLLQVVYKHVILGTKKKLFWKLYLWK